MKTPSTTAEFIKGMQDVQREILDIKLADALSAPHPQGSIVLYADHAAAMSQVQTQLDEALAQRDMAVSDLEAAKAELRRIYEEQAQAAEFKP